YASDEHRYLHSFPTRRSSDLGGLISSCDGMLFQILRPAAEQSAVILEIFESSGQRELGREMIPQISDATDHMRWRCIGREPVDEDRKSTRLNSSHLGISYAVF